MKKKCIIQCLTESDSIRPCSSDTLSLKKMPIFELAALFLHAANLLFSPVKKMGQWPIFYGASLLLHRLALPPSFLFLLLLLSLWAFEPISARTNSPLIGLTAKEGNHSFLSCLSFFFWHDVTRHLTRWSVWNKRRPKPIGRGLILLKGGRGWLPEQDVQERRSTTKNKGKENGKDTGVGVT